MDFAKGEILEISGGLSPPQQGMAAADRGREDEVARTSGDGWEQL